MCIRDSTCSQCSRASCGRHSWSTRASPLSANEVSNHRNAISLELMTDTVIGEFTYRRKLSGSGPEGLLALARQARSVYRRHPWMLNVSNAGPALEPRLRVHPRKSLAEGFEDGTDADMAPEPLAGIAYHDDGTTAWVDEVAAARFLWQDSKPAVAAWAFPQLQAQ